VATSAQTTKGPNKGAVLALMCVAQFMVVLDIAIVNVALPTIQKSLHVGESTLQWIIIAYGLTLGGFLLLGGRLADLLGRRRVLLAGLALFTIASLLAGVANSPGFLIGARALQGFGAALIPPTALSILAVTFTDGAERFKAIGIYGAVGGASASLGVVVSGLITDGPGWRWVFLINVPVGALLIAGAAKFLPADVRAKIRERFDAAGAISVTGGLLLLIYALNYGSSHKWGSGTTIGLFVGAVALLAAFVLIESRSRSPLVPGAAVKNRTLMAANLSAFFTFGAFFGFIFLGTLLMQNVYGYSATKTGVAWLSTTAVSFVVAGITGTKLVGVFGVRKLLIVGQALLAVSMLLLTRVPAGGSYAADLLPALILAGIAGGMAAPAAQIGALTGVAPEMAGLASGFVETLREIGGAVGVAAVATVLISKLGHGGQSVNAYHAAFWLIFIAAAAGAVSAVVSFPRKVTPPQVEAPAPTPVAADA